MNFTSYTYTFFLLGMLVAHWLAPRAARRPLLIAGSYVFYCSWHWQYGFLLFGLALFNWHYARRTLWPGTATAAVPEPRPRALAAGVAVNVAVLAVFKYSGFFVESVVDAGQLLHLPIHLAIPRILVPLGISFFVFQGIAYLVDVATGDEPFERFADFLLFKSFWPQLLAGPIVRLHEIRDQILTPRLLRYEDLAVGGQRVLIGFVKKAVLADTIGPFVDQVFAEHAHPVAADVVVGVLAFGLQIYFDFSGYSDIAIGSARLFGYEFPENFDFPYSARSPQEFWQRWHQSLSFWIRDYVFGPLSFAARRNRAAGLAATVAAMALCGLWHGPRWTFVIWGIWHGVLLVLGQTVLAPLWGRAGKGALGWPLMLAARASTLAAVGYGWLLFRSTSMAQAARLTRALFGGGLRPTVLRESPVLIIALVIAGLFLVTVLAPVTKRLADRPSPRRLWVAARPAVYCGLIALTIIAQQEATAFVYFQF